MASHRVFALFVVVVLPLLTGCDTAERSDLPTHAASMVSASDTLAARDSTQTLISSNVVKTEESAYKARSVFEPSKPDEGVVELPPTPSLSLAEISLGDLDGVGNKKAFTPAVISQTPDVIEKEFTILDSNALTIITATPDDHIGFRLGLKKTNSDGNAKNLIYDRRHYGRSVDPLILNHLALPKGTYTVLVRRDRMVNIKLEINTLAAPSEVIAASGDAKNMTLVTHDVLGRSENKNYFLKPKELLTDEVYTAVVTYPEGTALVSVLDGNGQIIDTRRGVSPLIMTGLRGSSWALTVTHRPGKNQTEEPKWRLKIFQTSEELSVDEALAVESISSDLLREPSDFRGWLDVSDTDKLSINKSASHDTKPYYLNYQGPNSKITYKSGATESARAGYRMRLGPFVSSMDLDISIAALGAAGGPYSFSYEIIESNKTVATEPEGINSKLYAADDKVYGSLSHAADRDYITFDLGTTAQMWRPIILGESIGSVEFSSPYETIYNARRDARKRDKRRFYLPDLYMGPGPVKIGISGQVGNYRVFMKPLGPPLKSSEREPNQKPFFRRVSFGQHYKGNLELTDIDNYSFFLEKPARIKVELSVPAGSTYYMNHRVNQEDDERSPFYRKPLVGNSSYQVDGQPGENVLSFSAKVPSPAEYQIMLDFMFPFGKQHLSAVESIQDSLPVRAFSQSGQRISLASIAEVATLEANKIWSPSSKIELGLKKENLDIAADLPTGIYPVWISNADESSVFKLYVVARPDAVNQYPHRVHTYPTSMHGGINVALAALGATWVSQTDYELDDDANLVKSNPAKAANVKALNDGIRALSSDRKYFHVMSNVLGEIYHPIIKLAGGKPIPIAGVVLTNRVQGLNKFSRFAIDVSTDNVVWTEVINDSLVSWDKRNFFPFANDGVNAAYVRLRPLSDSKQKELIALSEFEVIAKQGESGLGNVMITDVSLGASGRYIDSKEYARDLNIGLQHVNSSPVVKVINDTGFTGTGLTLSFTNQSIAEIDDVEFHFGNQRAQTSGYKAAVLPRYAKIRGSTSGPYGPFLQTVEVEIPEVISAEGVVKVSLPERIRANAINIEYRAESEAAERVQVPSYYTLFERAESPDYSSVLALGEEYQRRPYQAFSTVSDDAVIFSNNGDRLSTNGHLHVGEVELKKLFNNWFVKPIKGENTLTLRVKGEKGFSPNIDVTNILGEPAMALAQTDSKVSDETIYRFDLPEAGLNVVVGEPPRSTIFLMDQSASAQAYIARARRGVMDYADMMVKGEDQVHFAALGRDWLSDNWITDPITLRRKLVEYHTDGNSDGEGAIIEAAQRLKGVPGTRSIVILTDGDVGVVKDLYRHVAASNARIFPIKISSAKIWGNPLMATTTTVQWSEVSGGEMAYVLRDQDITDAYARVAARLLGPKSYELRATTETRLIKPGSISVRSKSVANELNVNETELTHHILFDASGSMLKRTGNTRRIEIARQAMLKFAKDSLSDKQKIGLRVFGGAADTCETNLIVNPSVGSTELFVSSILAIRPKNKAKTPIATALSKLTSDLANSPGAARVLLLTDGEETCDGDAGAIIDQLIRDDLASRVDIVSFALDPDVDRSNFKDWADRGRGLYIDAQDGASLSNALEQTTHARYDILKNGEVIISAKLGGESVSLPKGDYVVRANGRSYPAKVESQKDTKIVLE